MPQATRCADSAEAQIVCLNAVTHSAPSGVLVGAFSLCENAKAFARRANARTFFMRYPLPPWRPGVPFQAGDPISAVARCGVPGTCLRQAGAIGNYWEKLPHRRLTRQ